MADRNHYQVLGVSPRASTPQIRTAYRQLAYLLHPDRQSGSTEAERALADRRMREVNAAWATLSDPTRRSDYDRALGHQTSRSGSSGTGSGGSAASAASRRSDGRGSEAAGSSRPGSDREGSDRAGSGASTSGRTGAAGSRSAAGGSSGSGPGHTGGSGDQSGDWWDSDDPDAAFLQARSADLDLDEPDLTGPHHWLLRRGPVVLVLVVGLVIFVASAYAGKSTGDPATATTPPPPVVADSDCVKFFPDGVAAYNVSCEGRFDATIVRELPSASSVGTCSAEGFKYASMRNKFYCVDPN